MSWISEQSAAISALGSVVMNISTIAIIFFNMHQFKLNRSTLNIDINFRLFDKRKKLYDNLYALLELLNSHSNFNIFTEEKEGVLVTNSRFAEIKEMIEDSEYIFSHDLYISLSELLDLFTQGVSIETQTHDIKTKDVQEWTEQTTEELKDLSERSKLLLNSISKFDISMLAQYLNISLFSNDFIGEKRNFKQNKFSNILLVRNSPDKTASIENKLQNIRF